MVQQCTVMPSDARLPKYYMNICSLPTQDHSLYEENRCGIEYNIKGIVQILPYNAISGIIDFMIKFFDALN